MAAHSETGVYVRGERDSPRSLFLLEKLMKFSSSLKKNHIFRRLYASKGVANSYFVLYARPNRTSHNYVGITVSKKLGHAVVRNRTRRRIREIYRLHEEAFLPGWDIVAVARSRAVDAEFSRLTSAFLSLANKAGLLRQKEGDWL